VEDAAEGDLEMDGDYEMEEEQMHDQMEWSNAILIVNSFSKTSAHI
jgi:hypothetical protein